MDPAMKWWAVYQDINGIWYLGVEGGQILERDTRRFYLKC